MQLVENKISQGMQNCYDHFLTAFETSANGSYTNVLQGGVLVESEVEYNFTLYFMDY